MMNSCCWGSKEYERVDSSENLNFDFSHPEVTCLCRSDRLVGNAFDLILVSHPETEGLACNDAIVYFGPTVGPVCADMTRYYLVLRVGTVNFRIVGKNIRLLDDSLERERMHGEEFKTTHDPKALRELESLLNEGKNTARYLLLDDYNEVRGIAPVDIYHWSTSDKVCIVDIDGTITKSNVRGLIDTVFTQSYSHIHDGICQFLSSIEGTRFIFVTSRPIGIANFTRQIFLETNQEGHTIPSGPLIGFPGSLAEILEMELISHSVNAFKLSALENHLVRLFQRAGGHNPLRAGIGNSLMDMQAYTEAGLSMEDCYLIGKDSTIYCLDKEVEDTKDRSKFLAARGTMFRGYTDESLLQHIARKIR